MHWLQGMREGLSLRRDLRLPKGPDSGLARGQHPQGEGREEQGSLIRAVSLPPRPRSLASRLESFVLRLRFLVFLERLQLFLFLQALGLLWLRRLDYFGNRRHSAAPTLRGGPIYRALALICSAFGADRIRLLHVVELGCAFIANVLSAKVFGRHAFHLEVRRRAA